MNIRYGVVVAAHPEDHSVDVVMVDNYSRLAGVQVLSGNGGQSFGLLDLYCPTELSGADKWDVAKNSANPKAAIDFSGQMPVVVGFLYPQIGQMTFKDKNRRIDRHSSDVYSTLTSTGDYELSFPNGTFVRIGASPDHEDLTAKDFDKKWLIGKNKDAATHLRVVLGNNGAVKADMHIDPDGNLTASFQGTGNITTAGNLTVNAPNVTVNTGTAIVNASSKVELATPLVHCTAALTVDGLITGKGGMALSGGSGAQVTGNINSTGTITGANVKQGAIDLAAHHHTAQGATSPTTAAQA